MTDYGIGYDLYLLSQAVSALEVREELELDDINEVRAQASRLLRLANEIDLIRRPAACQTISLP